MRTLSFFRKARKDTNNKLNIKYNKKWKTETITDVTS